MNGRVRVWTFITYPDSLPKNYIELISGIKFMFPFIMSPLHDKDLKPDSTPETNPFHPYKKPHFHNMVIFSQVKSYKQITEMVKENLGAGHCDQVHSTQAMVRYFIHADHKGKAQYKKEDIQCFNGADLENLFEKNDREIYQNLGDMLQAIETENFIEYSDFINHVRENCFDEWFPLVVGQYSFFLKNYITSKRFKAMEGK